MEEILLFSVTGLTVGAVYGVIFGMIANYLDF